jgi:hypothetical protein
MSANESEISCIGENCAIYNIAYSKCSIAVMGERLIECEKVLDNIKDDTSDISDLSEIKNTVNQIQDAVGTILLDNMK